MVVYFVGSIEELGEGDWPITMDESMVVGSGDLTSCVCHGPEREGVSGILDMATRREVSKG